MKITIEIGLDDLLEEVEDAESGNTYYEIKEDTNLKYDIEQNIKNTIINNLHYDAYRGIATGIENIVKECKEEIVEKVVKTVSQKIIQTKAMRDFKKQLEVDENDK